MNLDPLAEVYHTDTPYAYVLNNPMSFIDPDGREVIGVTKDDASKVHNDINTVFADSKFDKLRALFTRGKKNNKKTFDKIDGDALKDALSGLKGDDLALAEIVTGAINSEAEHKIEYVDIASDASTEGTTAYKEMVNSAQAGFGDALVKGTQVSAKIVYRINGAGVNAQTDKGSHSIIIDGTGVSHEESNRSLTTFHELFGHGIPNAKKVSAKINNENAIRTENLTRRVLKIKSQRSGAKHGGGVVNKPSALPTVKN